ncbi:MAG TPA: restriction endonuclease, partial [Solirubrobacterales bacterium]|nr:restriction endonuclease [Solirubrobacterales bacterium]
MGYEVTPNVQLAGKQTDLVARREVEGGPMMTLAIECKDHARPIDNSTVADFVATIASHRAQNLAISGVLVSRSGFTANGRATALENPFITLFSWEELSSRVLNVRHH